MKEKSRSKQRSDYSIKRTGRYSDAQAFRAQHQQPRGEQGCHDEAVLEAGQASSIKTTNSVFAGTLICQPPPSPKL